MSNDIAIIIGGGVVGLNIALELLARHFFKEIYLLEKEKFLGEHTSTRNSEVIHAGFAYDKGSQKARLCVEGNSLTFELAAKLGVNYRQKGKWIVAHNKQEAEGLHLLIDNARACGAKGIDIVDVAKFEEMFPSLARPSLCAFTPSSGIIDVSGYMRALEIMLRSQGNVELIYPCKVFGFDTSKNIVITDRGEMPYDLVINAAGLCADEVYHMTGGGRNFEIRPYKGEYYTWKGLRIDALIYPVSKRFLMKGDATKISSMGVHLHRSVTGEPYIGPTDIFIKGQAKEDYSITTTPEKIIEQVSPLLKVAPNKNDITPAFAGNRPKLFEDGRAIGDFVIFRDDAFIHLLGIESPGLTAAPAIAKYVADLCR